MSISEKIQAAESAYQKGESAYGVCSQKVQAIRQKKEELKARAERMREDFARTQQKEQQAQQQVEKCDHGIASIDRAISMLQSRRNDDEDGDDSVQDQIASLQADRAALEQQRQYSMQEIHECQSRYREIKTELDHIRSEQAACETELQNVRSECQSNINAMSAQQAAMQQTAGELDSAAQATQKVAFLRFGKSVASQKNAWSRSESQRAGALAGNLDSCIQKTASLMDSLQGNAPVSAPSPAAAAAAGGGSAKQGGWNGMETAPSPNGSGWTVLPGNHFDRYAAIEKDYSSHPRTGYAKENRPIRTVDPADIEGVYLGDSDVEDPSRFWNMHNGSQDEWMETASHIPEVRDRLNRGESLDSLLADEKLGRCAQAYFNPDSSKAIEVDEMAGGGYLFNGDGRHRIIAARMYGHQIPVRIAGIRH